VAAEHLRSRLAAKSPKTRDDIAALVVLARTALVEFFGIDQNAFAN
jgi:hypothetical protein